MAKRGPKAKKVTKVEKVDKVEKKVKIDAPKAVGKNYLGQDLYED